jgi:hypothetical protein
MRKLIAATIGIALSIGLVGVGLATEGATTSVSGTLEDSFCWVTMGAHGPSHKKCATECAKAGIPVSLVQNDTGKVYILLPPKNKSPLPDSVLTHMEDEVTVTGKEYTKGGATYLTVESVK